MKHLNEGDVIARVVYARIIKVGHMVEGTGRNRRVKENVDSLLCEDLSTNGHRFQIDGEDLIDSFESSEQWGTSEPKSMTELAEILVNAGYSPFLVTFTKQDGENRTLRGRLVKPEPLLGRSLVQDFEADDEGLRLVDHRTIQSIIIRGVYYKLKVDSRFDGLRTRSQQRRLAAQTSK